MSIRKQSIWSNTFSNIHSYFFYIQSIFFYHLFYLYFYSDTNLDDFFTQFNASSDDDLNIKNEWDFVHGLKYLQWTIVQINHEFIAVKSDKFKISQEYMERESIKIEKQMPIKWVRLKSGEYKNDIARVLPAVSDAVPEGQMLLKPQTYTMNWSVVRILTILLWILDALFKLKIFFLE